MAVFLSYYHTIGSSASTLEDALAELQQVERQQNTRAGSPLAELSRLEDMTLDRVRSDYRFIWKSPLFYELFDAFPSARQTFNVCRVEQDPLTLLYHAYLLCLWGEYEIRNPYLLYESIRRDTFARCYTASPALRTFIESAPNP